MDLIKNINLAFWFLGLIGCYNSLITFILFLLSHTFGQTDQKPLYSLNGITFWRGIRDITTVNIGNLLYLAFFCLFLVCVLPRNQVKLFIETMSESRASSAALRPVLENVVSNNTAKMEKFLPKPVCFSGEDQGILPKAWLKTIERLKKGFEFSDDEILMVATSYLVGPAGLWWESIEENVHTYNDFVREFTKQFASDDQVDAWWEELERLKQGEGQSVDALKFRCVELFGVLGVNSAAVRVRYFLRALKPVIAQRVTELGHSSSDWDAITASAKRVESSMKKYGGSQIANRYVRVIPEVRENLNGDPLRANNVETSTMRNNQVVTRDDDSVASLGSLSTIMKELCEGVRDLRLSVNTHFNSGSDSGSANVTRYPSFRVNEQRYHGGEPKCYACGQMGHIARYCSRPQQGNQSPQEPQYNHGVNPNNGSALVQGPSQTSQGKGLGRQ
jgi:hypothetical protein